MKHHKRKTEQNEKSGIVEKEHAIRWCKLALLEQKGKDKGQTTRVRFVINKDGKKVRVSKRSNQELVYNGK